MDMFFDQGPYSRPDRVPPPSDPFSSFWRGVTYGRTLEPLTPPLGFPFLPSECPHISIGNPNPPRILGVLSGIAAPRGFGFIKNKKSQKSCRSLKINFLAYLKVWDHSKIQDLIFLIWMVSTRASESSKTPHS